MREIEIKNETALLVLLNAQMSFPMFREDKTLLTAIELPFYREYVLVTAKTFSTIPSVKFDFLWSEKDNNVIRINGDRDCFFDNLNKLKPYITYQNAVEYIKFVLGSVWDENGAMRVCQSLDDVELSANLSQSQSSFLSSNIRPASVIDIGNMFIVNCNIVYGKALYKAKIKLQRGGLFDIVDEQQLGEEIEALRTIFLE